MNSNDKFITAILSLVTVFYLASGIVLYFFPQQTFDSLPAYYGVFNSHFVKDAGLAFLSSGLLLVLSVTRRNERFLFCFCASIFVVLHALFHLHMLYKGMVPGEYLSYELLQVLLPALVLFILVLIIYKRDNT